MSGDVRPVGELYISRSTPCVAGPPSVPAATRGRAPRPQPADDRSGRLHQLFRRRVDRGCAPLRTDAEAVPRTRWLGWKKSRLQGLASGVVLTSRISPRLSPDCIPRLQLPADYTNATGDTAVRMVRIQLCRRERRAVVRCFFMVLLRSLWDGVLQLRPRSQQQL